MTTKDMFEKAFPQEKQIGGSHYKSFHIQPYEFISKNNLSFFQGNVVKYVCRYLNKNGIEDLEKIIHYCELEIKKIKDMKSKKWNISASYVIRKTWHTIVLSNVKNVIKRKIMKEKGRRWDGRSRISTEQYKNNYDDIFKKKNVMTEKEWEQKLTGKKRNKNNV